MTEFVRNVLTGVSVAAILGMITGVWRTALAVRDAARTARDAASSAAVALRAARQVELAQAVDRERLRAVQRDIDRVRGNR